MITVNRQEIKYNEEDVGMTFTPLRNYIFADHDHIKSLQACKVAHSAFPIESYIGPLPPTLGRSLYMARVDPHLIYGAEVAI
jgi:hypothetical protein